jgi:CHASE1-domain containing sensor protein
MGSEVIEKVVVIDMVPLTTMGLEATGMDVASEHRTRLALRMKTHNSHVHAVDIRSNFKVRDITTVLGLI